jgi:hypothetical protein
MSTYDEVMKVPNRTRLSSFVTAVLCAAVLGLPGPLLAQGGSVLELLKPEGGLEVGGETHAALSASDARSPSDAFMEAWTLEGREGESVTVDMVSDDFDALLFVVGPGLEETLVDDDSGGGCNARITFTFLENGSFRVVASSAISRETGVYSLRVSGVPDPLISYACGELSPAVIAQLPTDGRSLTLGGSASGALSGSSATVTDQRKADAWSLEGRAGESVTVVAESEAFDTYLMIVGPGMDAVLSDDDGAGDLNSQLTMRFPADGTYRVVVTSANFAEYGPYTVRVEEPLDMSTLPTDGRIIEVGGTMQGVLNPSDPVVQDGQRGQAWALEGRAGETYSIDLMSSEFDAYLFFVGPGLEGPMSDDDGGDELNSRIMVTLPEDAVYRVIVSSAGMGGSGEFRLRVVGASRE